MEEMFKTAAENYELNEELAADWIKVRSILQSDEVSNISTKKEKKRRRLYLLWLLLLIPAILFMVYKAGFYSPGKTQHEQSTGIKKLNNTLQSKPSNEKSTTSRSNATEDLITTNRKKYSDVKNGKKIIIHNNSFSADRKLSLYSFKKNPANNNSVTPLAAPGINKEFLNNQAPLQQEIFTPGNSKPAIENNLITNNINSNQLNNNKADTVQTNTSKPGGQAGKKNKTDNYTRQAFAYAAFTGNTDISFIKFQKLSVPGFGIGVMGGYHFKNGISVETGVLYDKKNYYTKGEYFDKAKLSYLQSVNLISADGSCHMWEIPLNIKYDFSTQKKHNWFVTAGLSSYIMNKEYYNFQYEKNGVVNQKAYDFYHSSQDWFSVLNVGGGINIKTGKEYFLQVQPYYKIPLGGVGKGSLSLNSTGVNISVMRRLH
jgi:hypothetical protein